MSEATTSTLVAAVWAFLGGIDASAFPTSNVFELEAPPNKQGNFIIFKLLADPESDNFLGQPREIMALLEVAIYVPKFDFNEYNASGGTQSLRSIGDKFYNAIHNTILTVDDSAHFDGCSFVGRRRGVPKIDGDRLCITPTFLICGTRFNA